MNKYIVTFPRNVSQVSNALEIEADRVMFHDASRSVIFLKENVLPESKNKEEIVFTCPIDRYVYIAKRGASREIVGQLDGSEGVVENGGDNP